METKLTNKNYCGTIVEIKNIIPLDNCNNLCATMIMGNHVIVNKDTKLGEVGVFFPVECQLSDKYCKANNLYRDSTKNLVPTEKGYFEENRRIRCIKFRGHKSEGLFMPLLSLAIDSLSFSEIKKIDLTTEFNEIGGIAICQKYIIPTTKTPGEPGNKKTRTKKAMESILVENQFRFHQDTAQLYRNLQRINPDTLVHISYKVHGTSAISSNILTKKKLSWFKKLLKKTGFDVHDIEYSNIYASRSVIKNDKADPGFYKEDIWKIANDYLKEYIQKGMTLYYEVVGYLPSGGMIQKDFDYGCINPQTTAPDPYTYGIHYKIFIYRITYTNIDGKVFEFSGPQVQSWCFLNGLIPVIELFYGKAIGLLPMDLPKGAAFIGLDPESFGNTFLNKCKDLYNDKDCYICKNIVPEEGCVIRVEGMGFDAYKCKSSRFYLKETALLDKGVEDIESEN